MCYVVFRLTAGTSATRAAVFSLSVRGTAKDGRRRACLSVSVGSRGQKHFTQNTRPTHYKCVMLLSVLYLISMLLCSVLVTNLSIQVIDIKCNLFS